MKVLIVYETKYGNTKKAAETIGDVINILTEGEIKKPEPKKFKAEVCRICNAENNLQNTLCWKCNNVLDESKSTEAGLYLLNQTFLRIFCPCIKQN